MNTRLIHMITVIDKRDNVHVRESVAKDRNVIAFVLVFFFFVGSLLPLPRRRLPSPKRRPLSPKPRRRPPSLSPKRRPLSPRPRPPPPPLPLPPPLHRSPRPRPPPPPQPPRPPPPPLPPPLHRSPRHRREPSLQRTPAASLIFLISRTYTRMPARRPLRLRPLRLRPLPLRRPPKSQDPCTSAAKCVKRDSSSRDNALRVGLVKLIFVVKVVNVGLYNV